MKMSQFRPGSVPVNKYFNGTKKTSIFNGLHSFLGCPSVPAQKALVGTVITHIK